MGARGKLDQYERAKTQFGEWLAMNEVERKREGLARTQAEFADRWGISRRTVIRWKQDDSVVAEAYQRAEERRRKNERTDQLDEQLDELLSRRDDGDEGAEPVPAAPDDTDEAREEFEHIRKRLFEKAADGDQRALDTWMKHFGSDIMEQERAREESSFAHLSDVELEQEVLALIGEERVRALVGA